MSNSTTNTNNSCVETPAAPEWLSKLENRREKLKHGKLGHEAGAGAPCSECGDKCPGLDLHFWRKVCRNCKCRKDQHMCGDEELSGWAQFEILGQIRSKPAYIKIKALANQTVQVDWIPPNAAPDVVSDYMDKLGSSNIPVVGSDAASKRKQQLEFQVPPHDLDATLCDNLTESEANQLKQYVQKLRENCVGQGTVVRLGTVTHAQLGLVAPLQHLEDNDVFKPEYAAVMSHLNETQVADPVLAELLSNPKLSNAILAATTSTQPFPKLFIAFSEPLVESLQDFPVETKLSQPVREKLCGLNKRAVHSLVSNGPVYDKILATLRNKNFDISRDPRLGPIADFRKEYLKNPKFQQEISYLCPTTGNDTPQFATPVKAEYSKQEPTLFNSPLPLKNPIQTRFGAQMRQDTPIRKVKFGGVSTIVYDCGLPANVDYARDAVFSKIINSDELKEAFQNVRNGYDAEHPVVIELTPATPDFSSEDEDDSTRWSPLSPHIKNQLKSLPVNSKLVQSSLLNAPFYERLFETLNDKGIPYEDCKLLQPLDQLRRKLATDKPLNDQLLEFVTQMPNNFQVAYDISPHSSIKGTLTGSSSNDSGFDSKPSTPSNNSQADYFNALAGRFATIPGIEDMNMYPTVEPGVASYLPQAFKQLQLTQNNPNLGKESLQEQAPVLNCRDCTQAIGFGEVAVKAERAGKEIAWHPDCFKCHTCRELLADLVYFFHGGQVYCGRDLAIKLKIPRCKACDELIFTKEYTAAENATFHIKHFCCYQCDKPLAGQQYIPEEKSNMPLCLVCYNQYFAAACQRCQLQIGPSDQGVQWGDVHWHDSCFLCAGVGCCKSLIGGRFCVKQNMPFCSPQCVRSIIN